MTDHIVSFVVFMLCFMGAFFLILLGICAPGFFIALVLCGCCLQALDNNKKKKEKLVSSGDKPKIEDENGRVVGGHLINLLNQITSSRINNADPEFLADCYQIKLLITDLKKKDYKIDHQVLVSLDKILSGYLEISTSLMSQHKKDEYLTKIYALVAEIRNYIQGLYDEVYEKNHIDTEIEMELLKGKINSIDMEM